jgi:hypothetical protein
MLSQVWDSGYWMLDTRKNNFGHLVNRTFEKKSYKCIRAEGLSAKMGTHGN